MMFVESSRNKLRLGKSYFQWSSFTRISALVVLTLLPSVACLASDPPPTPDPSIRSDIDLLRDEVRALQQAVSELEPEPEVRSTPVPPLNDLVRGETICGRSPAVQRAILQGLGLSKCSEATNEELFRIESLELKTAKPFRSGDLTGLVNLSQLDMEIADTCGQWDDLTYTDSVLSQLPSLGNFSLQLYREKLYPDAASAEDIADAVFVSINEGIRTESDERYSESNQERMEARYRSGRVNVNVFIEAKERLYPCRRGIVQ